MQNLKGISLSEKELTAGMFSAYRQKNSNDGRGEGKRKGKREEGILVLGKYGPQFYRLGVAKCSRAAFFTETCFSNSLY